MKLFYYCYGSAHSSVTAANLHLGALPLHQRPPLRDLIHQPLFDRQEDAGLGTPHYMGRDEGGNYVYIVGLAGSHRQMAAALRDFLKEAGVNQPQQRVRLENALAHAGVLLRIGGYSSRRLGLVRVGRWLCGLGAWIKYPRFAAHVRDVKQSMGVRHLDSGQAIRHNR